MNPTLIADNLARIRQQIADAAKRSGRDAAAVTLVAVTKYVDLPEIEALLAAGCRHFGESRPQDLWRKNQALADRGIVWHLIGHLQRNKIRRTLPMVGLIHSGDRIALLNDLQQEALLANKTVRILLEVNVSGDATKHGFKPEEVAQVVQSAAQWPHLRIAGLMAMAGLESSPEAARREFAAVAQLARDLRQNCPNGVELTELSLGMSRDFEAAIEAGATLVRVGSALFEERQ